MIRFSFLLISIIAIIYGLIFFLTPFWFISLTEAETTNVAWLRNIGATIIGLLFFGCLSIYYKPQGKRAILKLITITTVLQTFGLIYSRVYNEFSAKNIVVIDLTIFLAVFIAIFFVWIL